MARVGSSAGRARSAPVSITSCSKTGAPHRLYDAALADQFHHGERDRERADRGERDRDRAAAERDRDRSAAAAAAGAERQRPSSRRRSGAEAALLQEAEAERQEAERQKAPTPPDPDAVRSLPTPPMTPLDSQDGLPLGALLENMGDALGDEDDGDESNYSLNFGATCAGDMPGPGRLAARAALRIRAIENAPTPPLDPDAVRYLPTPLRTPTRLSEDEYEVISQDDSHSHVISEDEHADLVLLPVCRD